MLVSDLPSELELYSLDESDEPLLSEFMSEGVPWVGYFLRGGVPSSIFSFLLALLSIVMYLEGFEFMLISGV